MLGSHILEALEKLSQFFIINEWTNQLIKCSSNGSPAVKNWDNFQFMLLSEIPCFNS